MSDEFESPGAATGVQWEKYKGCLLLFHVESVEKGVGTAFGEKDAVKAYVEILDGPTAPEGYAGALVFPKVLQAQLAGSVGKKVLGRLSQGAAKAGQKPPWRLVEATEEDTTIARQHLAKISVPDKAPF